MPTSIARRLAPAVLAGLSAALAACVPPTASGPLPQEAYVWQRRWTPAVAEAVRGAEGFRGLVALAAEVDPAADPPRLVRVAIDLDALAAAGPPALALRIGAAPDRFAARPALVDRLAGLAESLVADAAAEGRMLAELQVDHDCPASRLTDCALLLAAIRDRIAPVPLVFTALPSWLDAARGFERLLAAADGFVLQVHSLEPPSGSDAEIALCDPAAARRAVARAARFGRPFRVALPTYSYLLTFDAAGALAAVAAEEPPSPPPPGGSRRVAASDPAAMAELVRGWTAARPRMLGGVIWYRLPTADDRLNWPTETLAAVREGRVPEHRFELRVRRPEPSLAEVEVINRGEAVAEPPAEIELSWAGPPPLAADGLDGYRFQPTFDPGTASLRRAASGTLAPPAPGEARTVGWLRFAAAAEVEGVFR